jgi:hypothetical protein
LNIRKCELKFPKCRLFFQSNLMASVDISRNNTIVPRLLRPAASFCSALIQFCSVPLQCPPTVFWPGLTSVSPMWIRLLKKMVDTDCPLNVDPIGCFWVKQRFTSQGSHLIPEK